MIYSVTDGNYTALSKLRQHAEMKSKTQEESEPSRTKARRTVFSTFFEPWHIFHFEINHMAHHQKYKIKIFLFS